jgi:hypothetical protein
VGNINFIVEIRRRGTVDRILLAQDKDQWRQVVPTVINLCSIKGEELLEYLTGNPRNKIPVNVKEADI